MLKPISRPPAVKEETAGNDGNNVDVVVSKTLTIPLRKKKKAAYSNTAFKLTQNYQDARTRSPRFTGSILPDLNLSDPKRIKATPANAKLFHFCKSALSQHFQSSV